MEQMIQTLLAETEKKFNIEILYACETGSRAWGFASPDSDFDIRLIYRHPVSWYLSLKNRPDHLQYMSEDRQLDLSGWDLKKSMHLLWKSNGAMLERVQSPIVYRNINNTQELLFDLAQACYTPIATMHHYLGMARKSYSDLQGKETVKLKTLFYALRAALACRWIREQDSMPPIVFTEMVEKLNFDADLKARIKELIVLKSQVDEGYLHHAENDVTAFIETELLTSASVFNTLGGRKQKQVDLDAAFITLLKYKDK